MKHPALSIYHDTRRAKAGDPAARKQPVNGAPTEPAQKDKGIYPVKLRVYHSGTTRLYPTGIDLAQEDFKRSYGAERPRGEHQELKIKISSHLTRAQDILDEMGAFTFEKFERRLLRPSGAGGDVFYHYRSKVTQLKAEESIKTASTYELSQKSLSKFLAARGQRSDRLTFDMVTPRFLNEYERWMQGEGKGLTTVSMYVRALRTLFNDAIREGDVDKDLYPFKKGLYDVPAGRNVKKALSKADLKKLLEYPTDDIYILKARDFWFFSYQCNGMNVRDICELRFGDLQSEKFTFIRTKTRRTTKSKQRVITVIRTPYVDTIINRYGNKPASPETYVFPVLTPGMSAQEKVRKVEALTRFINQHMKRLAKLAGVDEGISTYYARHSFATVAVQNGASLEYIQDSFGHGSIATTMNYWKGFDDEVKKELAGKLMEF